jgi:hypothetical protein
MTHKAQRIAIAEACGWKRAWSEYRNEYRWYGPDDMNWLLPPDYLNDLNAMYEAEKVLTGVEQDEYIGKLGWPADNTAHAAWKSTHATAAKRAEAFLRTLNLWQSTPCATPPTPQTPT